MLTPVQDLLKIVRPNQRCLTALQAKTEIEQNQGLLIDVREPAEFQAKAAPKAVNIPRGLLEFKLPELEKDAQRPIYVHCAAGGRAVFAAEQLTRLGYQNVSVITCKADEVCQVF
ncbi:rhodanese-like domain-containing protein [Pseudoalteromonas sp. JBTF-M23]|uniref:Rhodanese-like domain-containing protein n=1 Tax=Pseudoalteromonas caenipelagi TaxID=2726988 RepID=A0A849VJF3_9GAMM|nr:rhodanese-like domain-containing protein [Pseudoalteromonas caenipelagi]NOU52930.1 rhodanese-like domain-containing protein [Pseudoalteromonas caenipelagi]